jgi:hypothetical protein
MLCNVTVALIGLVGVLIGLVLGNRLAWGKDDRDRRINFAARMCELKSLADKIEDHNFPEWFAKVQVEVEKQCALVESAIRWRHRKQFITARKKCAESQTQNDIADPRPFIPGLPVGLDRLPSFTYRAGMLRIGDILENLITAAR